MREEILLLNGGFSPCFAKSDGDQEKKAPCYRGGWRHRRLHRLSKGSGDHVLLLLARQGVKPHRIA